MSLAPLAGIMLSSGLFVSTERWLQMPSCIEVAARESAVLIGICIPCCWTNMLPVHTVHVCSSCGQLCTNAVTMLIVLYITMQFIHVGSTFICPSSMANVMHKCTKWVKMTVMILAYRYSHDIKINVHVLGMWCLQ